MLTKCKQGRQGSSLEHCIFKQQRQRCPHGTVRQDIRLPTLLGEPRQRNPAHLRGTSRLRGASLAARDETGAQARCGAVEVKEGPDRGDAGSPARAPGARTRAAEVLRDLRKHLRDVAPGAPQRRPPFLLLLLLLLLRVAHLMLLLLLLLPPPPVLVLPASEGRLLNIGGAAARLSRCSPPDKACAASSEARAVALSSKGSPRASRGPKRSGSAGNAVESEMSSDITSGKLIG
mmetsp:Transcript_56818/g.144076  ORF Transcript_56818/g.144076 Transcript_56818/m.144076 type:complete len:233 (+) Transcript_56818:3-701(+)